MISHERVRAVSVCIAALVHIISIGFSRVFIFSLTQPNPTAHKLKQQDGKNNKIHNAEFKVKIAVAVLTVELTGYDPVFQPCKGRVLPSERKPQESETRFLFFGALPIELLSEFPPTAETRTRNQRLIRLTIKIAVRALYQ